MNSSFSKALPVLQLAWDATSLTALKRCPRYYQYSIIEGWQTRAESVHLTFGLLYHAALERFDHLRTQGVSHEDALCAVVKWTLCATWDKTTGRPWVSDHPAKNRWTLIRSIVWYLDQFQEDPLQTLVLASGKPAVELSFSFELGSAAYTGEEFVLCGHLDRVAKLGDETFIVDRKTTGSTLYPEFFAKYNPDNQFSCYTLAGKVAFGLPLRGLIVDVAQVAVSFTRFMRQPVFRDDLQIEEWQQDTIEWIKLAQHYAASGHWPQNDTACDHYGGCPFRQVCSKSPLARSQWLEAGFTKRVWDPLQRRGDI